MNILTKAKEGEDVSEHYELLLDKILPVLQCPNCQSPNLKMTPVSQTRNISLPLWNEEIICSDCQTWHPITHDFIPIMWTPSIKKYLENQNEQSQNSLTANMAVYDSISDDYNIYMHRNSITEQRMKNAAKKTLGTDKKSSQLHLDFGCGPGHVLGWLSDQGLQQFGLDVSLVNLRNARKQTNALVICGDASKMPFKNSSFSLVTESSALHHIEDWQSTVSEACRVCDKNKDGGIILDSEPSQELMNWSWLAIKVFELRFVPYQILSYLLPKTRFFLFRDRKEAKLNTLAEIHHQPKTGFPLPTLTKIFENRGFKCTIILAPSETLETCPKPNKFQIILDLLSFRNPWNPKYSSFIAIAKPNK